MLKGAEVHSLICFYTALGQKMMSEKGSNSNYAPFLPSGVYSMTIETNQGRVNKTLVREYLFLHSNFCQASPKSGALIYHQMNLMGS